MPRFLKLKKLLERAFAPFFEIKKTFGESFYYFLLLLIYYRFLKLKKLLERVFAWVNLFLKFVKIFSQKYPPGLRTSTLRT